MDGDVEMVADADQQERKHLDLAKPVEFQSTSVSCIQECESKNAEKLCIFDFKLKLENPGEYDIGGTYTNKKSDIWFYMTTSICPGENYLLNLFLCQRNVGFISLGVSKCNIIQTDAKNEQYGFLKEDLTWKTFKASQKDECQYIKTFVFHRSDVLKKDILVIPLKIEIYSGFKLNNVIVERVKEKHNIGSLLKKEMSDCTLESASHKKYEAHLIMLCARSPVLKDMIKTSNSNSLSLSINNDEMEILLEFLYSGCVKDMNNIDKVVLLDLALKFKLNELFILVEKALKEQINVENVLDIAQISQKYNLLAVEKAVFKFVKENRQVLETGAWKNLNDIALTKKLFEHLYFEKCV